MVGAYLPILPRIFVAGLLSVAFDLLGIALFGFGVIGSSQFGLAGCMGDDYAIVSQMSALTVSLLRACVPFLLLVVDGSGQTPSPQTTNTTKSVVNSAKLGSVTCLNAGEAFEMFDLNREQWHVVDGAIQGKVGAETGKGEFLTKKPFNASEFSFGFSVRSRWYQGVVLLLDDSKFVFSRGHWGNAATLSALNGVEKRLPGQVLEAGQYHAVELHYAQGEATVYYDGKPVEKRRFAKHSSIPIFFVGFIGYDTDYSIKDLFLVTKQVGGG
jgi:hypothetical protein